MKRAALTLAALSLLSACARDQVALAPGENGSIAVLDQKTGTEVSVVDTPGSIAQISGAKVGIKPLSAAAFDRLNADLLAALPREPRAFTLYFQENSTDLTVEAEALIPSIFEEIKARPGADIQVTGHTDTVGADGTNDSFSLRRAAEVTSILFTMGMDKAIVRLAGRGERELKEPTPDDTSSAINRRVEVTVR